MCVVWGTTYLAIRIAIETLPPFSMSGVRWVIAGSILLVVLKFKGTPMLPVREWPRQVLLGTLLIGFGNGGVVWAEKWVPSGLASLFVTVTPFWLLGVERFIFVTPVRSGACCATAFRRDGVGAAPKGSAHYVVWGTGIDD